MQLLWVLSPVCSRMGALMCAFNVIWVLSFVCCVRSFVCLICVCLHVCMLSHVFIIFLFRIRIGGSSQMDTPPKAKIRMLSLKVTPRRYQFVLMILEAAFGFWLVSSKTLSRKPNSTSWNCSAISAYTGAESLVSICKLATALNTNSVFIFCWRFVSSSLQALYFQFEGWNYPWILVAFVRNPQI